MDELAERAKLAILDLTDDVIELIIEKKRKAFAKKQEEVAVVVPPVIDEIPSPSVDCGRNHNEIEEPTYYPPSEPVPIPLPPPPTPVIPEQPMDRSVEPVMKRGLSWLRRR